MKDEPGSSGIGIAGDGTLNQPSPLFGLNAATPFGSHSQADDISAELQADDIEFEFVQSDDCSNERNDQSSSPNQHERYHIHQRQRERERERDANVSKTNLVQQFNSKNAKICAFFIVCGFILYHTILRLTHGLDSCNWLLSDGNFRDQVWQPYGCMMHHYSHADSKRCLRYIQYWEGKNHFAFVGDSRIEQMYHAFIHQILPSYKGIKVTDDKPSQGPVPGVPEKKIYDGTGSKFQQILEDEFLFPPRKLLGRSQSFNDTELGLQVQFLSHTLPNKSMVSALRKWQVAAEMPRVLVIGTGSWSIRESGADPSPLLIDEYSGSLATLVMQLDRLAEAGVKVLWALQEPVNSDPAILVDDWSLLTNEKIDQYNAEAMKVLRHSKADIWSSARLVARENIEQTIDGFHLGAKTLFQDTQILLNMYCNDNMNYNDATCCSSSENISKLQIVTFSFLGVGLILTVLGIMKQRLWNTRVHKGLSYNRLYGIEKDKSVNNVQGSGCYSKPMIAFSKLAILMAFFFICDRTTMFMKENKFFTQTNFWLPVVYILVLGIFFTEDSSFTKVMHHDQDNETKGWMILLILVYNVMGASQVLPIYMFVKILYTAFLFLHGWNQVLNYLYRGDYSFVRCFQDLFRLNMMAVMLCLCMNLPYQFYEFIPLISFWTLIVYVALSIPPRVTFTDCESNSLNYLYLVLKIVGLISFVTILYMSEVFFEKVFVTRPWKALFVSTDDDIHDWWTRWKIDRYSMPCGMICALCSHLARRYQVLHDDNHGNLFSMRISLSAILVSFVGIGGYCLFSVYCRNQQECLEIHAYVGFIPVASYIILRNISGILRTRFSTFFAWFGQFWVELLVGQFHVWMAADGSGVLVLVPAYPVGNVLLTAFVFACTAHEIHECTEALIPVAVPEDWKKALRNLFIFLLILIPIGISDGMF